MNLLNKKSLIIYFTHTGENYMSDGIRNIEKGNTEIIAEMIKDIIRCEFLYLFGKTTFVDLSFPIFIIRYFIDKKSRKLDKI